MNARELREELLGEWSVKVKNFYYETDITFGAISSGMTDEELMEKWAKWQIEKEET